ncbi:MAG TPA: hypothetical protein VJU86_11940 [Pyrinomonadaceae bacterium]|nr:hypothetical protein [Pyrinomonadaceae bacterium]
MAELAFLATTLRATAFFATARFGVAVDFLAVAFFVALLFVEVFAFVAFLAIGFCTEARFAFGLADAEVTFLRFAADFAEGREAAARDVERLKPLVTALMEASS